jgi:hypothetical protein
MPTMSEDQRHALLVYLNIEGFRAGAMTAIDNDIVYLLDDNGFTIPNYQSGAGTGNAMFGGGKQYSKHVQTNFNDSNIQTWMGLTGEGEADNYTRAIVAPPANTGDSKSSKRNSVGDPLPARVLKPEFFDHNGMMARNILSIASTGMPDPSWISAAKKVAAGANYLSEFPANLRDTYALGSRGVHPRLGATTSAPAPAPAPTPTPAAPAPQKKVLMPVVDETEPIEVVVEEITAPTGTTYLGTNDVVTTALKTVRSNGRSLNDATWASRDTNMGGMYSYDTNKQPLEIIFKQHPNNDILQPPVTGKNMGTVDLFSGSEIVAEVDASPATKIVIQDGSVFIEINSESYQLTFDVVTVEVVWERSTDNITGVVVRFGNGTEVLRIVNNKITLLNIEDTPDETILDLSSAPADIWVAPEILYDVSEIDNPVVYIGYQREDDYGISSVSSPRDDYNAALNEVRDGGYGFGYFSPEVTIKGSLGVYEGGSFDSDGTPHEENYWLSRIVVQTSDALDVSKTYIAVNIVFDTDTSTTTDLYNGGSETKKEETLIFPGDENTLDLLETPFSGDKTVMAAIGIDNTGLRSLMLTEINTSTAVVAVDEDGTLLGYSTVTDADLTFTNITSGDSKKIHIPNPDDEFAAVDLLGQTLRGRVESIELRQGDAAGAYQKQKAIRRQQRMNDAFNIRNVSKSDENATATIAFSKGNKYYIVGRHKNPSGRIVPVMVELELNF